MSIRPHEIDISPASRPAQSENVVPAKVMRQVFLGGSRDYLVEVDGGTQLRVIASTAQTWSSGSTVWLHLPPECCQGALVG